MSREFCLVGARVCSWEPTSVIPKKRARTARIDPEACETCGLVGVYRCHDRAHTGGGLMDSETESTITHYYYHLYRAMTIPARRRGIRSREAESGGQGEMEDGITEGCVDVSSRHYKLVKPRYVTPIHDRRKEEKRTMSSQVNPVSSYR